MRVTAVIALAGLATTIACRPAAPRISASDVEGRWLFHGDFALSMLVTGFEIDAAGDSLRAIVSLSGRQLAARGRLTPDGFALHTNGDGALSLIGRLRGDTMVVTISRASTGAPIVSRFRRQT